MMIFTILLKWNLDFMIIKKVKEKRMVCILIVQGGIDKIYRSSHKVFLICGFSHDKDRFLFPFNLLKYQVYIISIVWWRGCLEVWMDEILSSSLKRSLCLQITGVQAIPNFYKNKKISIYLWLHFSLWNLVALCYQINL